jgi:hypothetical protein
MRRLRFVLFSASIVSDFGNPVATTVRALSQALIAQGHDVVHCEERRNNHVLDLLTHRGSEPLRAFNAAFPLLVYRQFDVSGGSARRIWFSREISTADVVVGFQGCDPGVMSEIQELRSERTLAFYPGSPLLNGREESLWFQPAVYPRVSKTGRAGTIAVGYDHRVVDSEVSNRFTAGSLSDPEWTPVTELDLIERYDTTERVLFAAKDTEGWGLARALLPVASGAVAEIRDDQGVVLSTLTQLNDEFNAAIRAQEIQAHVVGLLDRSALQSS